MYVCRTLSYKGAEFEVVEVPLEPNMTVIDSREISNKVPTFYLHIQFNPYIFFITGLVLNTGYYIQF